MRNVAVFAAALAVLAVSLVAQENKPVPKDSVRVAIPGCTKGQMFTVGRRTIEEAGSVDVPEGTHLRMNGPKKMMAEIKAHEGSMIVITGLMKKGQFGPQGLRIGGGVRVTAGSPAPGGIMGGANVSQIMIDVEGWRQAMGSCPGR
jgi:hypothetical protein